MEASVISPAEARPIPVLTSEIRRLVVVALVFLVLGAGLGYRVAVSVLPQPPPPGPAVARYMTGLQRMDGAAIWASMSADYQQQAIREGDTPSSFAAFYQGMKERGNRIDQVQYVGGYQTKEKGIFVYVTRRFDPGKEPLEIVWILVTGPEGLVDYVL